MPISTIINAFFKESEVPGCWKLANICPIPKNKQVIDVNIDLRPTLYPLPHHSVKLPKMPIYIKYDLKPALMDCLDCKEFGFIPDSNTTLALIALIHRWSETVDKESGCVRSLVTD